MQQTFLPDTCHWIGINDKQSEGTWRYDSDDSKIVTSLWGSGQPDGGTGQNCAYQYYYSGANWDDYPCGDAGCYSLCELE